jgi:hypothetical protein
VREFITDLKPATKLLFDTDVADAKLFILPTDLVE